MFSAMLPLLYALIAAAGMAVRPRTLLFVRIYLVYVLAAGIAGPIFIYAASKHVYWSAFWTVELTHNVLLCLMALEIICRLVPRRFVLAWASAFLCILAVALIRSLPDSHTPIILNLSLSAVFVAGILLVALVFSREIEWTREYLLSAIGAAAIILGSAIPSLQWIHGQMAAWAIQIGPLAGLILLSCARQAATESRTMAACG